MLHTALKIDLWPIYRLILEKIDSKKYNNNTNNAEGKHISTTTLYIYILIQIIKTSIN